MKPQLPIAERRIVLREVRASFLTIADAPADYKPHDAAEVARILRKEYGLHEDVQEGLYALYYDSRGNLLAHENVYRGTINGANVGTRDIARSALMLNATSVIVSHNHPTGNPEPSTDDLTYTHRLKQALALFSIELTDHVIVGGRRHYSFRENGHA